MSDIRLKVITVEPQAAPLVIKNGNVNITDSTPSTSIITGSCVLNGGMGIGATESASSASAGGALTIGGGIGVMKNSVFGGDLFLSSSNSTFSVDGISVPRLLLQSTSNKSLEIAPDGVNKRLTLNDTSLSLNMTAPSLNSSTGSLYVIGGLSIGATQNVSSNTAGGALTIAGGIGITKDAMIGGNVVISSSLTAGSCAISNVVCTNITASTLRGSNAICTSISTSTLRVSVGITSGAVCISGGPLIATFNSNTIGSIITSGGNVGIGGNLLLQSNSTDATLKISNGDLSGTELLMSNTLSSGGSFSFNVGGDYKGSLSVYDNVNSATRIILISSGNVGIGTSNPSSLFHANGTITANMYTGANLSVTATSSGTLAYNNAIGTASSIGGLAVTNVVCGAISTGILVASTGITSAAAQITNANITTLTAGTTRFTDMNGTNISAGTYNASTGITSSSIRFTNAVGTNISSSTLNVSAGITTGSLRASVIFVTSGGLNATHDNNTIGSIITTGGNVGINTSSPANTLDVRGTAGFGTSSRIKLGTGLATGEAGISFIYDSGNNYGWTQVEQQGTAYRNYVINPSGGNVGINTSGPNVLLSLGAANSTQKLGILDTPNNFYGMGAANNLMHFHSGAVSGAVGQMVINTGGSVGIGTSNPASTLHVNGLITSTTLTTGNAGINSLTSASLTCVNGNATNMTVGTLRGTGIAALSGTVQSTSVSNGVMVISGGVGIAKNTNIGGDVLISSTTNSSTVSSGALLVNGGVGISGNLNVLGSTVVNGNLTVNGATTTVVSTNTTVNDNLLLLNAGPSGTRDSGIIVGRFQTDNDNGTGDVVNDSLYTTDIIPNQTGMSSTQLKLSGAASAVNGFYVGQWVKVTSGFSNNQVRKIVGYDGSTKVLTLSSAWTTQNPAIGDVLFIYNKPFVGIVYNEILDRFEFGATVGDPGQTNVTFTERIPIAFSIATGVGSVPASNASTGTVLLSGGISISNTTDASSVTNGGTLLTLGGASIGKNLIVGSGLTVAGTSLTPNVGDTITSVTFNGGNNVSSPTDVTGLSFSSGVWGFDIYLVARLVATKNNYVNFHLRGVNKGSSWELIQGYVGDDSGINFSITNGGQIQYTSSNYAGFVSLTFKWRSFAN